MDPLRPGRQRRLLPEGGITRDGNEMNVTGRFALALILLLALITLGTVGYMHLEGWSLQQSLYMTIVTMSTVGFREMGVLSPAGEWFTMLFILLSITFVGFAAASITAFLVQGELRDLMKGRRMHKQIEKLDNHYILCGCGSVGREIVAEFRASGVPFVVVEKSPEEAGVPRDPDFPLLQGDAADEETLEMAGIRRARGLIAALRSDPENVFVTLTARQLNPHLQIVARAGEKGTRSKLLRAGADRVISPFEIAGKRMASTVLRPNVVSFLDVMTRGGGSDLRLEEVRVSPASELVGKSLRDASLGSKTRAVILAINDAGGEPRVPPSSEMSLSQLPLQEGDILIAMGNDREIQRLQEVTG